MNATIEKSFFEVYEYEELHKGYYDDCSRFYVVGEKFKLLSKSVETTSTGRAVDVPTTHTSFHFSYFDYALQKEMKKDFLIAFCSQWRLDLLSKAEKKIMAFKVGDVFYANGEKFSDGSIGFTKVFLR